MSHTQCARTQITCNAWACNNFEFTFQLMTVGLLNTKGFQNLKYCIRSKGFLEHLEAFLYPTVCEISLFGFVVKLQIPIVLGSMHVGQCDCFIIIVYNVRRDMLLPVLNHSHQKPAVAASNI